DPRGEFRSLAAIAWTGLLVLHQTPAGLRWLARIWTASEPVETGEKRSCLIPPRPCRQQPELIKQAPPSFLRAPVPIAFWPQRSIHSLSACAPFVSCAGFGAVALRRQPWSPMSTVTQSGHGDHSSGGEPL